MEMLQVIIVMSVIMWYVIDRFKPAWESWTYGKYVTIGIAAAFAFTLAFGFGLDLLLALGVTTEVSTIGIVLTALTLMGGSSAVSELIERIKI